MVDVSPYICRIPRGHKRGAHQAPARAIRLGMCALRWSSTWWQFLEDNNAARDTGGDRGVVEIPQADEGVDVVVEVRHGLTRTEVVSGMKVASVFCRRDDVL